MSPGTAWPPRRAWPGFVARSPAWPSPAPPPSGPAAGLNTWCGPSRPSPPDRGSPAILDPGAAPRPGGRAPDDLLLLYSDGLIERRDRSLEEGLARLSRAVRGIADPELAIDAALRALGSTEAEDDTCLVALRVL